MNQNNNNQTEKHLLLQSMEKLIKHISENRKNQLEIFQSLSKQDFNKIIQNFSDQHPKLRKLSLTLLALLLNDINQEIKYKFCERMNINPIPGKICIDMKLDTKQLNFHKVKELFTLLKQPIKKQDEHFVVWMINLRKDPLTIDFVSISAISYIDPLDHLIGFLLNQEQKPIEIIQHHESISGSVSAFSPQFTRKRPENTMSTEAHRFSSTSTQISSRFSRTNHPKTSLKPSSRQQNSKESGSKQKYLNISQRIKSQTNSPNRQKFQFTKKPLNQPFQPKEYILKTPPRQEYQKLQTDRIIYQPIINNTNVYINTPMTELKLNTYYQPKIKTPKGLAVLTARGQNQSSFRPSNSNCLTDHFQPTLLTQRKSYEGFSQRKPYERMTKKSDIKEPREFNLNQYKQFINQITTRVDR